MRSSKSDLIRIDGTVFAECSIMINFEGSPKNENMPVILIADANPRILSFLANEFGDAGFVVKKAGNADAFMIKVNEPPAACLLVLDPHLPFGGGKKVMEKITFLEMKIPVVIYSPYDEYADHPDYRSADAFVEKTANPVFLIEIDKKILGVK